VSGVSLRFSASQNRPGFFPIFFLTAALTPLKIFSTFFESCFLSTAKGLSKPGVVVMKGALGWIKSVKERRFGRPPSSVRKQLLSSRLYLELLEQRESPTQAGVAAGIAAGLETVANPQTADPVPPPRLCPA